MATTTRQREARIVLHDVSWETYECLLQDYENRYVPSFIYDRGALETDMSPILSDDEERKDKTTLLVNVLAEEWGIDVSSFGSMTMKRRDIQGGLEPDSCFYIQNEARVRGKRRIDMVVDPPPDVVIEVDITSHSIDKLPIYARFGVPESWRHDAGRLDNRVLEGDRYIESEESRVLPGVRADELWDLIEKSRTMGRVTWLKEVRRWARRIFTEEGTTSTDRQDR